MLLQGYKGSINKCITNIYNIVSYIVSLVGKIVSVKESKCYIDNIQCYKDITTKEANVHSKIYLLVSGYMCTLISCTLLL